MFEMPHPENLTHSLSMIFYFILNDDNFIIKGRKDNKEHTVYNFKQGSVIQHTKKLKYKPSKPWLREFGPFTLHLQNLVIELQKNA